MIKIFLIALSLIILSTAKVADKESELIKTKMEADGIVPDHLEEAPSAKITIIYAGNASVELGAELTPLQVKDKPEVKWEADPSKYYTLLMFDPDAPSRDAPKYGDVNHWLVGNILGCDVATGEVIADYAGSGPPKGTGFHRYIFLVFEQDGKLEFDEPKSSSTTRAHRLNFSVRNFRKKYNLKKAYAGNYFKAQWDEYVEERKKHIKDN